MAKAKKLELESPAPVLDEETLVAIYADPKCKPWADKERGLQR